VAQILLDLQQQGPTQQEVERAKRNIIAGACERWSASRLRREGGPPHNYQVFLGDPGYLPGTSPGTAR